MKITKNKYLVLSLNHEILTPSNFPFYGITIFWTISQQLYMQLDTDLIWVSDQPMYSYVFLYFPQHGSFSSIEDAIEAVANKLKIKLTPIFHTYSECIVHVESTILYCFIQILLSLPKFYLDTK